MEPTTLRQQEPQAIIYHIFNWNVTLTRNYPILHIIGAFDRASMEGNIRVLDHINHLYTLTMKSNRDISDYDTHNLHEARDNTMELLNSLCNPHDLGLFLGLQRSTGFSMDLTKLC